MSDQDLYKMKLHDLIGNLEQKNYEVLRVPGGWIYTSWVKGEEFVSQSSVFVPLNSEFNRREPQA